MKASEETKQAAKAEGIKSWHLKSEEVLQKELGAEAELESTDAPANYADRMMELIDLKGDFTWDSLAMKCALMGQKSKFWEYKDIIDKQLEKMNGN